MKWLNTSIVVTVSFTTHAAIHTVLFQPLSVLRRSILRTAVRMMKEPFCRSLCLVGLFQCTKLTVSRQSCVCSGLKRLLDTSYLVEYVISVTILIWGICFKLLIQYVGWNRHWMTGVGSLYRSVDGSLSWYDWRFFPSFEYFCMQLMCNLTRTINSLRLLIMEMDSTSYSLMSLRSFRFFRIQPLVKSAPWYAKNWAHLLAPKHRAVFLNKAKLYFGSLVK